MLLVARERVAHWLADKVPMRLLSTLSTVSSGRGPRPSHPFPLYRPDQKPSHL